MSHYQAANPALWTGRVDSEEGLPALRWHQQIQCLDLDQAPALAGKLALLGFACDEGVRRNQGRVGASAGPDAIRTALANLAAGETQGLADLGGVHCEDQDLESAQAQLGERLARLLAAGAHPVVLGGGHEVAWGSFQGLVPTLNADADKVLGIINFDAHFDLRNPKPQASSGTAFRQMAEWCAGNRRDFNYLVLGANPSANTTALFDYARGHGVRWTTDLEVELSAWDRLAALLDDFVAEVDYLYLTVCLDVFNAASAPGVSAPAALGISPARGLALLDYVLQAARARDVAVLLLDIAELNPRFDPSGQTAKLAARLVWEYAQWTSTV